jgi:hypothetical protein
VRAGRLRAGAGALAARRRPTPLGPLADHDGAQPRAGPAAPHSGRDRQAEGDSGVLAHRRTRRRRRRQRSGRAPAADFTCCHPALPLEARVALTLRSLAGLTTAEIARAFIVPEPTMAKRLVRAKGKIRHAGIPYHVPPAHLLPERIGGVLRVPYLLFNEGYAATAEAHLVRRELCAEAIRLARMLAALMPDEPEALGLLALMLLRHARRAARVDDAGDVVTLKHHAPARWDTSEMTRACACWTRPCGTTAPAPSSCIRPSAPATPLPPRRGHRLGQDRPVVRAAGPARPPRWSSSTGRWRWRPAAGLKLVGRCRPPGHWPAITCCPPAR